MPFTKESSRSEASRANILLYLSAFVAFLGVPLFFYTTSIHRAHLPAEEVQQRSATFSKDTRFQIPVYVQSWSDSKDIITQTQSVIDASLVQKNLHHAWGLVLKAGDTTTIDKTQDYSVKFEQGAPSPETNEDAQLSYNFSPVSKEITVFWSPPSASSSPATEKLATYASEVLLEVIFKEELAAISNTLSDAHSADVVFPYSPTYNVVFNLFVEDGRPVNWQIDEAIEFIQPIFDALGNFCTFRVSSQVHYYSRLHNEPMFNEDHSARIISQSDLSTFINYGEWNLNTHDIAPSINFLVFFPKSNYENIPLLVENSRSNSFLIPQWGGVHIFNTKNAVDKTSTFELTQADLEPVFDGFASQLFELLGVPKAPSSPLLRVASFHRMATLKNLKRSLSNLSALLKISNSLNGISIPESTKANVEDSIENYDKAIEKLHSNEFGASVAYAAKSVEKSDKAFFEKEMVQQAYFPSEHKLAVFSPLLGPICSIVFFGLVKYIKSQKDKKAKESEEAQKKEI
ncbi:hypothetical protein JCM33374_g5547 [Metschnikowia sp. JCM 33374]|nr:hypothetical protein JCM33374_g5547 [Metschnikowia sp. JCM 33374]